MKNAPDADPVSNQGEPESRLEREREARSRMKESYLQFLRFGMGVVLGALLLQASETLLEKHTFWTDYRFVLQLMSLVIFLELWLVITKYHQALNVPYYGDVLFVDLFLLSLSFLVFTREVRMHTGHLPGTFMLLAGIFLLLFVRQAVPYCYANPSRRVRRQLQVAMAADFVGAGLCACAMRAAINTTFLSLQVLQWSWVGFGVLVIYMVIFRFGVRLAREPSD